MKGKDWGIIIVSAIILANTLIYSLLDLLRYQSYNAGVYDLGVASQILYGVTHGQLNFKDVVANKLIYIPMGFLYSIDPNPVFLQYFQAFFLSLGALPVYLISGEKLKGKGIPVCFALLWVLYFPLSGSYWFDFHFMTMFPTLFLFGIYFHMRQNTKLALLFLFLASVTDFLAPIILAFFAVYAAYSDARFRGIDPYRNRVAIPLLLFVSIIFIFVISYYGISYFSQYVDQQILTYNPVGNAVPVSYAYKLGYFIYLMLPLLFLSIFGFEFLITLVPYASLAILNNYYPYVNTLLYQYPSLTAATLFVAAILGVSRIINGKRIHISRKKVRNIVVGAVVFNIFLAAFLTPVGNLYTQSDVGAQVTHYLAGMSRNYNTSSSIETNGNVSAMNSIAGYIPKGSSVLIQDNMAQFVDNYNWTLPYTYVFSRPVQYVIVDTYSPDFEHFFLGNNSSRNMMSLVNSFIANGSYYPVYQNGGIMLLSLSQKGEIYYHGLSMQLREKSIQELNSTLHSMILTPGNFTFSLSGDPGIAQDLNLTLFYRTNPYGKTEQRDITLINVNGTLTGFLNNSVFSEIYGVQINYNHSSQVLFNLSMDEAEPLW